MRALCLAVLILPAPLWAEDLPLFARPTSVTVYPTGALVSRAVDFDVLEGQHRLILGGLPDLGELAFDLALEGAVLTGATFRQSRTESPDAALPQAVRAAKAEMDALHEELAQAQDAVAVLRAGAEAAAARIAFLTGLGDSDGAAAMPLDDLRALARMIGDETARARADAVAADADARRADAALADLKRRVRAAENRYDMLRGPAETAELVASVVGPGGPGRITVTSFSDGTWQPVYDFRLDVEGGAVLVDRSVLVRQNGDENWTDVALTLSTDLPGQELDASDRFYNRRRIDDPAERAFDRMEAVAAAPMVEPSIAVEESAMAASYDGLAVIYALPDPVTIFSGADAALFRLDGFTLPAEVFAAAIPRNDPTAHITAKFSNVADEILLPSETARFHVDGRFVGSGWFDGLVPGAEVELGFGPIPGLRLTRTVLNQLEGDKGVLNRSNVKDEQVLVEAENLTPRDWNVRLREAVYYSEQEDLRIDWAATPSPDAEDIDNRRGVLQWDLTLAPGEAAEIRVEQRLTWPEDKVLR